MDQDAGHLMGELQKLIAEFEVLAKSALAEIEKNLGHEFRLGTHQADRYVRDRPWLVVGIAAAAAFLGLLTRFSHV